MKVSSIKVTSRRYNALVAIVAFALGCTAFWLCSGVGPTATAQSTSTRIAVIDVQKVLSQSTAGKAAVTKLSQLQNDRLTRAKAMDEEVRRLNTTLTNTRATLTPTRISELQRQIEEKQTALKRYGEDAQREINETRDRELQALEARISPVVNALGREMGLAAIFNKFESGLIFASDAIDITDSVITRFNAAAPVTSPARPPAAATTPTRP